MKSWALAKPDCSGLLKLRTYICRSFGTPEGALTSRFFVTGWWELLSRRLSWLPVTSQMPKLKILSVPLSTSKSGNFIRFDELFLTVFKYRSVSSEGWPNLFSLGNYFDLIFSVFCLNFLIFFYVCMWPLNIISPIETSNSFLFLFYFLIVNVMLC